MSSQARDWRRLAEYVVTRRRALGMNQDDVKAAGGPSAATVRNIEGALNKSYKPHVIGRLERALRWEQGSIDSILAGGEPTPIEAMRPAAEPGREPTVAELAAQLAELERKLNQLLGEQEGHGKAG